jgi:hypothetical protein
MDPNTPTDGTDGEWSPQRPTLRIVGSPSWSAPSAHSTLNGRHSSQPEWNDEMTDNSDLIAELGEIDGPNLRSVELLIVGIQSMVNDDEVFLPSRERALVATKLDEAVLWLSRVREA